MYNVHVSAHTSRLVVCVREVMHSRESESISEVSGYTVYRVVKLIQSSLEGGWGRREEGRGRRKGEWR